MIICPKCHVECHSWAKTKNEKNWLKDHNGNWHICENKKTKTVDGFASRDWVECLVCKAKNYTAFVKREKTQIVNHVKTMHHDKTVEECFKDG